MIEHGKLNMRTITLGISLLECVDGNPKALNEKVYKKITALAKNLVSAGQDIEADFGIPIVNKRISVTPIALVGGSACRHPEGFATIAKTLDIAAEKVGVNFIGSCSALVSKGMTRADKDLILSIPQALSQTERVCSSVNVGSAETGTDIDAMELMGRIVTETAEAARDHDSLGCAKLMIFCNAPDNSPFMVSAFHGVTESEAVIDVSVSGPGAAKVALAKVRGANFEVLCETIKKTAFKITRMGQLVAQEASRRMGIPLGIIDLSPVPTPSIGDNATEVLEEIELEHVGAPGTTAVLTMLNDQIKRGDVMASSYMDGLGGTFTLVSEDQGMIDTVSMGVLMVKKLEAVTCICSVGLDIIAIPGDTPSSTIAGIITGGATTRMMNQKTTIVHLIPVVRKKVGGTAEFDGLPGYAPIMPMNTFSCR